MEDELTVTGLTIAGVRNLIRIRIQKMEESLKHDGARTGHGAKARVAFELGVPASTLTNVLAGRRPPPASILTMLGYRPSTVYVPVTQ